MASHPQITMKPLQREAQPPRAKMAAAPAPKRKGAPAVEAFTAGEIDVAEQLLHLIESSASSGAPHAAPHRRALVGSGCSDYSSRSVDAPRALARPPAILLGSCVDWEEELEENEVAGRQRRVKRYRLIADIYAATEVIGGRTGQKNNKE